MNRISNKNLGGILFLILLTLSLLVISLASCTKDEEDVVIPPYNSTQQKMLFSYKRDDFASSYRTYALTGQLGSEIAYYFNDSNMGGWGTMAGIEVGTSQFVFGHNWGDQPYNKEFTIRPILSNGDWGDAIQTGSWAHNYETVFGFRLGSRGFLFGLDSYDDHHWFVQEVGANGYLASDESDNGDWNNFYPTATPVYVRDRTYLFFQTKSNDNYWFMSAVSPNGQLSDVADGYWGNFWESATSVEIGGKTYLIGCRARGTMTDLTEWFIQEVNYDGYFGAETDRGTWSDLYNTLVGYTYDGKAYIYGYKDTQTDPGYWFTQEITAGGKMGPETSRGRMDGDYVFFHPFNRYEPGSLRYAVGWDLSLTSGEPSRSWSSLFTDPWTVPTKFGGGAALANINRDNGERLDAVLMGIQDYAGSNRYFYKVAWDLNGTGAATSWSPVIYGPTIGGSQSGGGADIADINGNGTPDLLLMVVDNPAQNNSFWYNIGWDLGTNGQPASWGQTIKVGDLGWDNAGGGAALGFIDDNSMVDAVLVGIDDPGQDNSFWYIVGQNMGTDGVAKNWTPRKAAPCNIGWSSAGGGAALAYINDNGKPDLVLMNIDSPPGRNVFWYFIGWDIDIEGNVSGWSPKFAGPSPGNMTIGGGTAIGDIDKNGILDMLLMSVDDPYGKD